jgi:3-oxoadipyl-CoA thiolase
MREVVIVDAIRTPIGNLGGTLSAVRPDDLAAHVLQTLVKRTSLDVNLIDDIYFGCSNQAGEDNRNVARMATLLAGLPCTIPAATINRLCASGLTAINLAAQTIKAGEADVIIAGGVESMSRAPYSLPKSDQAFSFGNLTAWDTALGWRYPNPRMEATYGVEPMGVTAENIAEMTGITRLEQDAFALQSHQRAIAAIDSGRFQDEIIPVPIPQKKGEPTLFTTDERPRRDTSLDSLGRLRPAFKKDGSVTAGNSSGLNDGAAALLIMEAEKALALGYKPLARFVASAAAGVEPRIMGIGPIPATQKVLSRAGLSVSDLQLVEINEAFAIQSLAVLHELGISEAIANVNGGAIALGHPLGCSGARIMTTLIHEMRKRSLLVAHPYYGLAALCVGVGQGVATIVEALPA